MAAAAGGGKDEDVERRLHAMLALMAKVDTYLTDISSPATARACLQMNESMQRKTERKKEGRKK